MTNRGGIQTLWMKQMILNPDTFRCPPINIIPDNNASGGFSETTVYKRMQKLTQKNIKGRIIYGNEGSYIFDENVRKESWNNQNKRWPNLAPLSNF